MIGNPLITKEMVKHVPDAGSYTPVTILTGERQDGVHLSYDKMASYLASYGSPEVLKVAHDLNAKVEAWRRTEFDCDNVMNTSAQLEGGTKDDK